MLCNSWTKEKTIWTLAHGRLEGTNERAGKAGGEYLNFTTQEKGGFSRNTAANTTIDVQYKPYSAISTHKKSFFIEAAMLSLS